MRGTWAVLWALLISTALEALASNVSCPIFLPVVSPNNALLDEDQVDELCVDDCYNSLKSARAIIKAACTETTDVIIVEDIAYPATFIADNYLLTYEVSPLGYDEGMDDNFKSLTSSCSATGYSVTSPTAAIASSTATPSCSSYYQVKQIDDCNSVAKSLGVSTYYLLQANNLDLYCQNFAAKVNQTLCVPAQCTTYTWQADDTCDSVVGGLVNVTLPQFFSWNPNINSLCLNAPFFIGYEVCLSPLSGYLNHTTSGSDSSTITTATAVATGLVAVPTNAMDISNRNYSQWYTVQEGDDCAKVSLAQSISLTDFYFLNPEIDANYTNLQLDEAYCVKAVGSITSYPNYTVTGVLLITITPVNFTYVNTAIPTATSDPGYEYTGTPLLPTASGTISGCYDYENPSNYTSQCVDMAAGYGISMKQLVAWNLSLENNASTCNLNMANSYCILRYENSTASTEDTDITCWPITATETGTASNCNCFTLIDMSDSPDYTCDDLVYDYSLTLAELVSWNSWLAGDCDAALYANLKVTDERAVCIGVGSASTSKTMTATGTTTTSTRTATQTISTMGPIPTDTVSGC
ncbi:hypothetical protein N7448_004956 [Penicillium atrosanguineum]|nr:hypothetical protein N7448_004956 [Penicillium atrosanguineum]